MKSAFPGKDQSSPLSVCAVIPAYNASKTLGLTLTCLRSQTLPPGIELSAVVVDDGSSDTTAEVVEQHVRSWPDLTYTHRMRDARSSRAAARNHGLARVNTDFVLWLDATVCLPQCWLSSALELVLSEPAGAVVLGETLGLDREATWPGAPPVARSVEDIANVTESVSALPAWQDPRGPYFELATPTLPTDLCPWTLGWTCLMLMPTSSAKRIGGFDEEFLGWGGEDVEFSLRLWQAGASFVVQSDPQALHWPHAAEDDGSKVRSMLSNVARIFNKHPGLETEVFSVIGHFAGTVLRRLETMPMEYVVPDYPEAVLSFLEQELGGSDRTLLLGGTLPLISRLPSISHLLAPSSQHAKRLAAAFPDRSILRALGARLPFEAGSFDLVIVTDFFGGLSTSLKLAVAAELRRVAKRTLFICSHDILSHARSSFGWARSSEDVLRRILTSLKAETLDIRRFDGEIVEAIVEVAGIRAQ